MTGRRVIVGAVTACILLLPFFLPENGVTIATRMLIAALFALAYNLLWRHGRLLSFGHAVYFGAGMFAAIHLMRAAESGRFTLPLPLIPLVGALAGALVGVLLGFLATTRGGTYFAMITLATGELAYAVGPRWDAVFGGESGISTMRMPWASFDFGSQTQVYGLALVWFLVGAAGLYGFAATPLGRITFALGENETRLRALGYRTHLTKTALFAISATVAGLAGALLAVANENVDYGIFSGVNSAQPVLQTFIGGAATFLGPAVGAVVLTWVGNQVSDMTRLWLLYQGLLFVAVVLFAPDGLTGWRGGSGRSPARLVRQRPRVAPSWASVVSRCWRSLSSSSPRPRSSCWVKITSRAGPAAAATGRTCICSRMTGRRCRR